MANTQARTYYLIAGERSGDLHGSNLIKALKKKDPDARFRCWGGDLMEEAGAELVTHYNKLAFMGIWEVILNLFTIRRLLNKAKKDLLETNPDVLILIDYPGFNMRMAKFAHEKGIKVYYYISPKIWAWNTKRAYKIKRNVDRMFVILPFEKSFYRQFEYEVDYVGNPLLDSRNDFTPNESFKNEHHLEGKPIIAILPGSRKQEINNMLELMLELSSKFPDYQFVVAAVRNLDPVFYEVAEQHPEVKVVYDQTYDLLSVAHAAVVTSGTATLETALFSVPQVVCYKTSWLSYVIGKRVIKVDYISLVNLIGEKLIVKELIQKDFNLEKLKTELALITTESADRAQQLKDYEEIYLKMKEGSPSEKAASLMYGYLTKN